MKKYLMTVIAVLACCVTQANANPPQTPPPPPLIELDNKSTKPDHKPHAPSRQSVRCYIEDGSLTIRFTYPEGIAHMCISDAFEVVDEYDFDSSADFTITLPDIYENIEVTTSYGNTYQGCLR